MSIFSNYKILDRKNSNPVNLQTSYSKLPTDESTIYNNNAPFKVAKLVRSQSLVASSLPHTEYSRIQSHPHEAADMAISIINYSQVHSNQGSQEPSPYLHKAVIRCHSVHKLTRPNPFPIQNMHEISGFNHQVNISSQQDFEVKENFSQPNYITSTKASAEKEKPLEKVNTEADSLTKTPEKALVHLPVIQKTVGKLDFGVLNRRKVEGKAPLSQRENYNIQSERTSNYVSNSSSSAGKLVKTAERFQSQGNISKILKKEKELNRLTPFVLKLDRNKSENSETKIYSTKMIAQLHNSIIKSIDLNQVEDKENHVIKVKECTEPHTLKKRAISSSEKVYSSKTNDIGNSKNKVDMLQPPQENKDFREFSFSKNFYKDKSAALLPTNLTNLMNSGKEIIEKNQLKVVKVVNNPGKEYLKAKSKVFVDSDLKKKFSLVRIKQLQA